MDNDKIAELVLNEVPGDSPDVRHIYEKLGFKENGILTTPEDQVWGGLTKMKLNLSK